MIRNTTDWLYPPIEPIQTGRLKVSPIHELYYEEVGNPRGKPALYLHGGPGGGISDFHRRFHDPEKYRIILFDQRGAGRSTPSASLEENTTWHLVEDIEKLRKHLGIEKWQVFGGSWGSTLALAYSETHPERVSEIVLRGIFLITRKEMEWFYEGKGAAFVFPEAWEQYQSVIPESERANMIEAYYKRLTSTDTATRLNAAKEWTKWEYSLISLLPNEHYLQEAEKPEHVEKIARIECHYFINKGFFKTDNHLIENVGKIRHIPAVIIHGRYDMICPAYAAWELHKAWPEADLVMIPDAGHASIEAGISRALIAATDRFAR